MSITLRHIGLVVQNLEDALIFWTFGMGFDVVSHQKESRPFIDNLVGLKNVDLTTVKLRDDSGNELELLKFFSHPGENCWSGSISSTGLTHIALNVDHLDDFIDRMKDYGVALLSEPQRSPDNMVLVAFARGPEGLIIELVETL